MLTSLTLHAPAVDNAGLFLDAGAEVVVGDEPAMIDATRARAIVSAHGATGHHSSAVVPKPSRKRKAGKPDASEEPTTPDQPETPADGGNADEPTE